MKTTFRGRVQSGKSDASRWLALFNVSYSRKLGCPVFPGSLNIALEHDFNWFEPLYEPHIISFPRLEYGGERDILFLECELQVPDRRKAWLWTPTTAARSRPDPWVIELVSDVRLRDFYALADGAVIELKLRLGVEGSIQGNTIPLSLGGE
jgi:CTP-dependent riboflavin kinase